MIETPAHEFTVEASFAITGRGLVVVGGSRWAGKGARPLHAEIHAPDGGVLHRTAWREMVGRPLDPAAPRDEREGILLDATEKPEVPIGSRVRLYRTDPRDPRLPPGLASEFPA